jgi:hypothetical protein
LLGIYLSKENEKCLERHQAPLYLQILYDFHKMQMFTKINQIIYVNRYLKINNICGKNNNKGVEYRHDKKKYFDII